MEWEKADPFFSLFSLWHVHECMWVCVCVCLTRVSYGIEREWEREENRSTHLYIHPRLGGSKNKRESSLVYSLSFLFTFHFHLEREEKREEREERQSSVERPWEKKNRARFFCTVVSLPPPLQYQRDSSPAHTQNRDKKGFLLSFHNKCIQWIWGPEKNVRRNNPSSRTHWKRRRRNSCLRLIWEKSTGKDLCGLWGIGERNPDDKYFSFFLFFSAWKKQKKTPTKECPFFFFFLSFFPDTGDASFFPLSGSVD